MGNQVNTQNLDGNDRELTTAEKAMWRKLVTCYANDQMPGQDEKAWGYTI